MTDPDLNPLYRHPDLVVSTCEFGHGVFAAADIPAHATLEECHHLKISSDDCRGIIDDYVFGLEPDEDEEDDAAEYCSLPLGWGSIYNHSDDPNTGYRHDADRDLIVFHTVKRVKAGEQLFVNYGKEWWETRGLTPSDGPMADTKDGKGKADC
jgi:SET domain-containing protein